METEHNKHPDLKPVTLLSTDYAEQQQGLCQCGHKSAKFMWKRTGPHSSGQFVCSYSWFIYSETLQDLRGAED